MGDQPDNFEALLDKMAPGVARKDAAAPGKPQPQLRPSLTVQSNLSIGSDAPIQGEVAVRIPGLSADSMSPGVTPQLPAAEVRERLSWASLQLALAMLLIYAVWALTYTPAYLDLARPGLVGSRATNLPMEHLAAAGTILLALAVFGLARGHKLPDAFVEGLGLVFYVLVAMGVSLFEYWEPWPTRYSPISISLVCLWITLYPMVVPCSRSRLSLAAVVAASSGPLALLLSVAIQGSSWPSVQVLTWVLVPPYACAALTVYPAPYIHRVQAAAKRARELGSYQLLEQLAEGGMGTLWKARHRLLARPAAIKLIRPDVLFGMQARQREDTMRRFEREARITASLCSPHTVQLLDFGVTEEGALYNVMELLDGIDLDQLVRQHGRQPPERVVNLLVQACDSLAEAHSRGLVHRDIKPANLMICRYGLVADFVKVLDFGLVRAVDPTGDGGERMTALGAVAGTPATIAPELARGAVEYDHRVDLYAMGCVGYWLLTGRNVFQAQTGQAMMMEHVQTQPDPPSRHAPGVPPELDALILECLAKQPQDRPHDAVVLKDRLLACPLAAPWTARDSDEWWAQHRGADSSAD